MSDQTFTGVVQFMHPGGEHRLDEMGWTGWNKGSHRRKFMVVDGTVVDERDRLVSTQLALWGEWEPPSVHIEQWTPRPGLPEHLVRPMYPGPPGPARGLQNTDPYVFGDRFRYTLCQQNTKVGMTAMTRLDLGTVVLFGSAVKDTFRLDTVLVVADWIDHDRGDWMQATADRISPVYRDVTMVPMYRDPGIRDEWRYRMYLGATATAPVHGMYSFFPCRRIAGATDVRFARPQIELAGIITQNQRQGRKLTRLGLDQLHEIWTRVVTQVRAAGLDIGVFAAEPALSEVPSHLWPAGDSSVEGCAR